MPVEAPQMGPCFILSNSEKLKRLPSRNFNASEGKLSGEKSWLFKTLVNNTTVLNLKGPRIPEIFDHLNVAVFINISDSWLIFIPQSAVRLHVQKECQLFRNSRSLAKTKSQIAVKLADLNQCDYSLSFGEDHKILPYAAYNSTNNY